MEPFQATERTCVVVGSLNPGIIQPDWLAAQFPEMVDASDDWLVDYAPLTNTVIFKSRGLGWQCTSRRLVVAATSPEGKPGIAVERVLQVLQHTPVRGVGNNFSFLISPEQGKARAPLLTPPIRERLAQKGRIVTAFSTALQLDRSGAAVTLTLEVSGEMLMRAGFNFHRNTADSAAAASAAAQWEADESAADEILSEIIQ